MECESPSCQLMYLRSRGLIRVSSQVGEVSHQLPFLALTTPRGIPMFSDPVVVIHYLFHNAIFGISALFLCSHTLGGGVINYVSCDAATKTFVLFFLFLHTVGMIYYLSRDPYYPSYISMDYFPKSSVSNYTKLDLNISV